MMTKDQILQAIHQGEGDHIEAKSAKGGFPDSLWETYSAFANTDGGVILLGVGEDKKTGKLFVEGLPDARKTEKDLWCMAGNRQKASINILTHSMVTVVDIDGKSVMAIEVPRVERELRPISKGPDPRTGSYRRYGDGDFLCSPDEVSAMLRDSSSSSLDCEVIDEMDETVFCQETIKAYRQVFRDTHPTHHWNNTDDTQFLRYLGAMGVGKDMKFHPTAAGLLMFGYEYEITRKFPNYFLDFKEKRKVLHTRWVDRITSQTGDWSGNLFDFAVKALTRLQADLKVPFAMRGVFRDDDTPIHQMLREALTNTLTNADYYGRQGVVITKDDDGFTFENPGNMRISVDSAIQGSISDPRGAVLLKMFSFIKFGERAGSGVSTIFSVWPIVYHEIPTLQETALNGVFRTRLHLPVGPDGPDIEAMLRLYAPSATQGPLGASEPAVPYLSRRPSSILQEIEQRRAAEHRQPRAVIDAAPTAPAYGAAPTPTYAAQPAPVDVTPPTPAYVAPPRLKGEALSNAIIKAVAATPTITLDELAEQCHVSRSTIKRQLKHLPQISYHGSAKRGQWHITQ
ncbi:MAG: putative DNA binding domain-containing protein [Bacteroidales bacterium]|nr:putative DNA binding domain-containing protein [Bacteroidales bacterium]